MPDKRVKTCLMRGGRVESVSLGCNSLRQNTRRNSGFTLLESLLLKSL